MRFIGVLGEPAMGPGSEVSKLISDAIEGHKNSSSNSGTDEELLVNHVLTTAPRLTKPPVHS